MPLRVLPVRAFVVETPLAPAEALDRLRAAVEAPIWRKGKLRTPTLRRPFVGAVDGDGFAMERATAARHAFLPVIEGRVEPAAAGSRIAGRIRLRYAGMAFLAVWFAGLLGGAGVLAWRAAAAGRFDPLVLAPVGLMGIGAALTVVGFVPETRHALGALARVVRASGAELR